MRKIILLIFFTFFLRCNSEKSNEMFFYPGQEWLDDNGVHINAHGGGILFNNDKYYWYGEHKVAGEIGNTAQVGVNVYSSTDLYNWKDEGIALKVDENNPESEISKGCIIERPKVIYNQKTGKFVMWFHLELKGEGYLSARAGVAISDNPKGPFKYLQSYRPNAGIWPVNVQDFHKRKIAVDIKDNYCGGPAGCLPKHVDSLNILGRDFKKGQMSRDMTLFVDDDGVAYHLYSSEENSTLHISKLSEDYLSHSGKYVRVFPDRYMEAPSIMKNSKGKYFFIASDCTGWAPNAARSAIAENIFGPWKELGNPAIGKDSLTTFYSQSNYILPVQGKDDAFIFMGDRWMPKNPIDGKYIWLPLKIKDDRVIMKWEDKWKLNTFN